MKKLLQSALGLFGYRFQSLADPIMDGDKDFLKIYNYCKDYSRTTKERMFALYEAVKYIVKNDIPGDFVECGVYKGGSMMVIAMTLKQLGAIRKLWLYDTFAGMPPAGTVDWPFFDPKAKGHPSFATIREVKNNMYAIYPWEQIVFVEGMVERTIPEHMPKEIALLRLDTDFYSSTKHELIHLYPRLAPRGVMIVDDYGAYNGAKKAVDETIPEQLYLRIDRDARLIIK